MVTSVFTVLSSSFSEVRVESYRQPGHTDDEVAATYLRNVALREALHPSLQAVEVALRNTMHRVIQSRHERAGHSEECWFDHLGYFPPRRGKGGELRPPRAIEDSRTFYRNRKEEPTTDQIISGTSLGFWTTCLSSRMRPLLWVPLGFTMLREMFPYARHGAGGMEFSEYWDAYDAIRRLRNRVSHYEKLSDRRDLLAVHARIYDSMGWINEDLPAIIESTDRFPVVHAIGLAESMERVRALSGS